VLRPTRIPKAWRRGRHQPETKHMFVATTSTLLANGAKSISQKHAAGSMRMAGQWAKQQQPAQLLVHLRQATLPKRRALAHLPWKTLSQHKTKHIGVYINGYSGLYFTQRNRERGGSAAYIIYLYIHIHMLLCGCVCVFGMWAPCVAIVCFYLHVLRAVQLGPFVYSWEPSHKKKPAQRHT
jgi:hypothetical protein